MRLGQLSRKVEIKPSEILDYLKNEFDIELGSHLNTKVDDALTEKVIAKFSKKSEIKPEPESKHEKKEETVEDEAIENATKPESIEKEEEIKPVVEFNQGEEINEATRLSTDVIKAPKVELTGPTVVGKIELPPSLEDQMVEIDGVMISKKEIAEKRKEERKQKREKRENSKKRTSKTARSSRMKSEAQLEQLKKDQEAEEIAKKIENREKRLSKKHNQQTRHTAKPFTPKKKIKKKTIKKQIIAQQEAQKEVNQKPKPTTWYGKLWLWFNT